MALLRFLSLAGLFLASQALVDADTDDKKHHKKHHKHDKHSAKQLKDTKLKMATPTAVQSPHAVPSAHNLQQELASKLAKLSADLKAVEAKKSAIPLVAGTIDVSGPLPKDFAQEFSSAVAGATGCPKSEVHILAVTPLVSLMQMSKQPNSHVFEVKFEAPAQVVDAVEDQAADQDSPLAKGQLHRFLVEGDSAQASPPQEEANPEEADPEMTPVSDGGIDIDTAMPYGELEPFGREDTAQELTESSITESDQMVDQLERAEVAEEKRAVFRALTRLRGAAITSFDGVARSQTGNIDEYNKLHKWRRTHPLHHLADEESDISKWAFPDNADF